MGDSQSEDDWARKLLNAFLAFIGWADDDQTEPCPQCGYPLGEQEDECEDDYEEDDEWEYDYEETCEGHWFSWDNVLLVGVIVGLSFASYHALGYSWLTAVGVVTVLIWMISPWWLDTEEWHTFVHLLLITILTAGVLGCALNVYYGRTPLHQLSLSGESWFAPIAMGLTYDIDATDRYGRTALHYAAARNWVRMTKFLLDHGARDDIEDCDGLTPLQFTRKRHEAETEIILEDRQAGLDARASETEQLNEMRDR